MKKKSGMGRVKVLSTLIILIAIALASVFFVGAEQDSAAYDTMAYKENWFICSPSMNGYSDLTQLGYSYVVTDGDGVHQSGELIDHLRGLPVVEQAFGRLDAEQVEIPNTPDISGIGGNSEFKFIPINEFGEFAPRGDIHPCDHDGDGVDRGTGAGDGGDEDGTACGQPRHGSPYDCNDNDRRVPALDDDGNWVEICSDGLDNDCDGTADENPENDPCIPFERSRELPSDTAFADRFICLGAEHSGYFFECVGNSYSDAINDLTRARRSGSILTTIKEFDCGSANVNCVARYKVVNDIQIEYNENNEEVEHNIDQFVGFLTDFTDIPIKDWTKYYYFDFFILFEGNYYLDIIIAKHTNLNDDTIDAFEPYLRAPVADYIIGKPELGKWLPVRVPIGNDWTDVDFVGFFVDGDEAKRFENSAYSVEDNDDNTYSNVIGFDKFHLVQRSRDDNPEELRYCTISATSPRPRWTTDLSRLSENFGYVGEGACNRFDLPSYDWTGTKCCGDSVYDQNEISYETYTDTEGGCWQANPILREILPNGETGGYTPFSYIEYEFNTGGVKSAVCTSDKTCLSPIPTVMQTVKNSHPASYKLNFLSWQENNLVMDDGAAISGSFESVQNKVYIKASDVPYNLIYQEADEGQFLGCHAAPYIDSILEGGDNLGTNLNSPENYCTEMGDYYCSFNKEWAKKEGEQAGGFDQNPVNNQKRGMNMIMNGGFEGETTGWSLDGNVQGNVVEEGAYSGKSLRITANGWVSQYVYDIKPGELYSISAFAKADSSRGLVAAYWFNGSTMNGNPLVTEAIAAEQESGWKFISGIGIAPDNTDRIRIRIKTEAIQNRDAFYIDDIQLRPVNLLRNGGFEVPDKSKLLGVEHKVRIRFNGIIHRQNVGTLGVFAVLPDADEENSIEVVELLENQRGSLPNGDVIFLDSIEHDRVSYATFYYAFAGNREMPEEIYDFDIKAERISGGQPRDYTVILKEDIPAAYDYLTYWHTLDYGSAYSDDAHSGENSFKLQFDRRSHWQWANQFVNGIVPGKEYSIYGWGKRVDTNSGYTRILVDWYGVDNDGVLTLLHPQDDNCDDDDISRFQTPGIESANWGASSGSGFAPKASETCENLPAVKANVRLLGRFSDRENDENAYFLLDGVQFREVNDLEAPFMDNTAGYQGCCPANKCWDSAQGTCVNDQYTGPASGPLYKDDTLNTALMCDNSDWSIFYKKQNYADNTFGYCPDKSMCFDGTSCITDGTIVANDDYVCEDGEWTSRTKYVAMALYDAVPIDNNVKVDYSLVCSPEVDVLSEAIFSGANNPSSVCILQYEAEDGQKVLAVGAPLVKNNEDSFNSFFEQTLLDGIDRRYFTPESSCTEVDENGQGLGNNKEFDRCTLNNRGPGNEPVYTGPIKAIYWHDSLKIFIISNYSYINIVSNPSSRAISEFDEIMGYDFDAEVIDDEQGEGLGSFENFRNTLKDLAPETSYYKYLLLMKKGESTYKALLEASQPNQIIYDRGWTYDVDSAYAAFFYEGIEPDNKVFEDLETWRFYRDASCEPVNGQSTEKRIFAKANAAQEEGAPLKTFWQDTSKRFTRYAQCAYETGYREASVPDDIARVYAANEYLLYNNPTVSSCCPMDHCWAGEGPNPIGEGRPDYDDNNKDACVRAIDDPDNIDRANDIFWLPRQGGRGYVCVKDRNNIAQWDDVYFKVHWDGDPAKNGPCDQLQCWKQKPGEDARCVDAGYYDEDHYCRPVLNNDDNRIDAVWSTRTSLVAAKLAEAASNEHSSDYTIFCDEDGNTLNTGLNDPQNIFNKFCTLRFNNGQDEKVVVGTSFNTRTEDVNAVMDEIETAMKALLRLGEDEEVICEIGRRLRGTGGQQELETIFTECEVSGDDWHVYVQPGTKLIVFSKLPVELGNQNILRALWQFLRNPFGFIEDLNRQHLTVPQDFDKIYMTERGELGIQGVVQDLAESKFVFTGYRTESEPCIAINLYDVTHLPLNENKLICDEEEDGLQHIAYTTTSDNAFTTGISIWPSLTSRLRPLFANFDEAPGGNFDFGGFIEDREENNLRFPDDEELPEEDNDDNA